MSGASSFALVTPDEPDRNAPALIYVSHAMAQVHGLLVSAVRMREDALIQGESGSGKEALVRAVVASIAPGRPFVEFRAAELPPDLQRAEWSGVVKGAYTGADCDRAGCVERADGGILLLSDCEQLTPDVQRTVRLFYDQRSVQRIGSGKPRRVGVQLILTSNVDLAASPSFLRDLYYRISRIVLTVPPLRERREDLDVLVSHFLNVLSRQGNRDITGIDEPFHRFVRAYDWPGNVRELENLLTQAALDKPASPVLRFTSIAHRVSQAKPAMRAPRRKSRCTLPDREQVAQALTTAPTRAEAAELLGISRRTLYTLCRRYGL